MAGRAGAVPSVWARRNKSGGQPALSRDRIVAEAIGLLDEEGIDALSMRALGSRLDAGATSLYRHVAGKDELIELVVDEVYGELPVPSSEGAGGWRAAVEGNARDLRAAALRHPWMVSVLGRVGLSRLGPNLAQVSEGLLGVFEAAGFGVEEADQAMSTVTAYVMGMVTSEVAYLSVFARSGRSESEWRESLAPAMEESLRDLPRLRAGHAAQEGRSLEEIRDSGFDYGLQRVLDGLEARLARLGGDG
ncbi:TetR/AcrR family transcriptional regulator [Nocardiopsis tropica]|uniref:TetR/AcrR family transcriptional regulator n=1 Tax=Nocardiopsis tropica TaxID=109330 RepID=UPI002E8C892B|nr:TetR/AcrR family transcriptional regulator [Nocardiopsis tropica]